MVQIGRRSNCRCSRAHKQSNLDDRVLGVKRVFEKHAGHLATDLGNRFICNFCGQTADIGAPVCLFKLSNASLCLIACSLVSAGSMLQVRRQVCLKRLCHCYYCRAPLSRTSRSCLACVYKRKMTIPLTQTKAAQIQHIHTRNQA